MSDKNAFKDTLNLPQTEFPMRANLPTNEPKWIERWDQEDVYGKLRQKGQGKNKFILHLGPPYANGNMHMGHALTYVLKDFIVRAKGMEGYDAVYVPGWDCHGLPIEWKVEVGLREQGKSKKDLSIKELRDLCRAEASKWVKIQMGEWQRFGCLGDWDEPYLTMNKKNEAGMVRELGKIMNGGFLTKGVRSVMWSPVEETALAEAEIEYKDKESTAIYVRYSLVDGDDSSRESVVIWTTTPWTMPASKAVAYAENEEYSAVKCTKAHEKAVVNEGEVCWVASALVADFAKMCGFEEYEVVATQMGKAFEGKFAKHPYLGDELPMLEGFHVTTDSGTGFVHTAPSHGAEDFEIGQKNGLDLACHVRGDGTYDETVAVLPKTCETLTGVSIWDAQKAIVNELTEQRALLRWYKYTHSYPVSWRSKQPVIYRTTPQWFIDLDQPSDRLDGQTIRQRALDCIHGTGGVNKVQWVPGYGENRIGSMIANRGNWCVSRQRAWGVPIAVFSYEKDGERHYVNDMDVFNHIADIMEVDGIDAWEMRPSEELLPTGWLEKNGLKASDLTKETDILDVWFDSGTTHAHVLRNDPERFGRNDGKRPADMYLEGSDQHRGWFHSSMLTSVANYGDAPYESVVTNGFVVDGEGKKMSKSVGNVVAPADLISKYGMDIVRLWVASADYAEDIRLSDEIMKGVADSYRRFRNTFRFLLGNLDGFNPETDAVPYAELPALEKWVLSKFTHVLQQARKDYDVYQFHRVYHAMHNFCAVELSNIYFDIRKDCLYCDAPEAQRRRSCQTVLHVLLSGLTTLLAPLAPFTTDEVWRSYFGSDVESIHLGSFFEPDAAWANPLMEADWAKLFELRADVNQRIEEIRQQGAVGSNLEVKLALTLPQDEWASVVDGVDLEELLIVSECSVEWGDFNIAVSKTALDKCPRCWTFNEQMSTSHPNVCARCGEALASTEQKDRAIA